MRPPFWEHVREWVCKRFGHRIPKKGKTWMCNDRQFGLCPRCNRQLEKISDGWKSI